jgi:hypothetical protein
MQIKITSKFGQAPDWVGFNRETLDYARRLSDKMKGRLLRKMAEVEWCKCRDDIEYWLDASRHMPTTNWPKGTPYVFTHDPHEMYKCNLCPQSQTEPLLVVEKSRDMVATWTIVMLYTWDTLFHEGAQNILQSLTAAKAYDLVDRGWRIYKHQPAFLKRVHRATRTKGDMKGGVLEVPSLGSAMMGFPQDPDTVRQFHPRGLFQDEAAFMPKAGDAFAAAKPTIQNGGRYTAISSANAGWFQCVCEDKLGNYEE